MGPILHTKTFFKDMILKNQELMKKIPKPILPQKKNFNAMILKNQELKEETIPKPKIVYFSQIAS